MKDLLMNDETFCAEIEAKVREAIQANKEQNRTTRQDTTAEE